MSYKFVTLPVRYIDSFEVFDILGSSKWKVQ